MTKSLSTVLSLLLLLPVQLSAGTAVSPLAVADSCQMVHLDVECLPDLNIARASHNALLVDGRLMVFGGHTEGFVPTPTAECYEDGQWHVLNMVYAHDGGLMVPLRSGRVLLAGGFEQPLGIGQTFVFEYYDPATRTFTGYGCLDQKRAFCSGVELADSSVIITGNWYCEDGIERFDGSRQNSFVAGVTQQRAHPLVFRTAPDDAIIFSAYDNYWNLQDTIIIDRLKGEPYTVALFERYCPLGTQPSRSFDDSFTGDAQKGSYAYIFSMVDRKTGQIALAQTKGTAISQLPTTEPIPMRGPWGAIYWNTKVLVDRQLRRAYIYGTNGKTGHRRFYVAAIDYRQTPAPLTTYYTDTLGADVARETQPILTADGNIALLGGYIDNNFAPSASALILRVNGHAYRSEAEGLPVWLWVLVGVAVAAGGILLWRRYSRHSASPVMAEASVAGNADSQELMERIHQLMDDRQPYLNPDLKVTDVASLLGVNSRYVSDCIKAVRGCSFPQYISTWRIDHAKRLLEQQPDAKIAAVAIQSGFANETSFFRTFKAVTGKTPREWITQAG